MLRKHHILDVLGGILIGFLESFIISCIWIERDTAVAMFNWVSDEKTMPWSGIGNFLSRFVVL